LITVGLLPVTAKVKDTPLPTPPDHVTLNEEVVNAENVMPVMAVGGEYTVNGELDTLLPVLEVAVMVSVHEVAAVKLDKVALPFGPAVKADTVGVLPGIANTYVTKPDAPPVHVIVNPVAVQAEATPITMGVGSAYTVNILLAKLPPV